MQMRPLEKAAPAFSGSFGGSVLHVLDVDAVVIVDGGVSSDVVSRYVLVTCQVQVKWSCVVLTQCCRLLSVGICVNLTWM